MQRKNYLNITRVIVILVLLTSFNLIVQASTSPSSQKMTSSITILPSADAYVRESYPNTNFGSSRTLYVDNVPVTHSFLRFDVTGLNGSTAQSAKLRIYANSSNKIGFTVSSVTASDWTEKSITFNNSPVIGEQINTSKPIIRNTWVEVDVTSAIISDGSYSFAITTTSARNTNLDSREAGSRAPQLIITIDTPVVSTAETLSTTLTPSMDITEMQSTQVAPSSTPEQITTSTDTPVLISIATSTPVLDETPSATSTFTEIPILTTNQDQIYFPVADTYVDQSMPDYNFGGSSSLRVDESPLVTSYLRFTLSGLSQSLISHAEIQIYDNSNSTQGLVVRSVDDNSWNEMTMTYSNAPAPRDTIASTDAVSSGNWIIMDVTSYVTGEGTYSFNISTPDSTAINLSSRESGSNSPRLIVSFSGIPTPMVTPIYTDTATETVTPTATVSITPDLSTTNLPIATETETQTSIPSASATPTRTETPTPPPTSTPTNIFTPTNVPTPGGDPVLVGAGDISSCSNTGDDATAKLLDNIPGTVFTAGDNAYESGSDSEYTNCYNPTWGRFKSGRILHQETMSTIHLVHQVTMAILALQRVTLPRVIIPITWVPGISLY